MADKKYPTWVKVLVVVGPALITGVSNYFSSKAEAEIAKNKANLGYEALVTQVNRLQEDAEKKSLESAGFDGRLSLVEKFILQSRTASAMSVRPPTPFKPAAEKSPDFRQEKLPENLDALVEMKAKK